MNFESLQYDNHVCLFATEKRVWDSLRYELLIDRRFV